MTFGDQIRLAIRTFILTLLADEVVTDIATNGLSPADEAIVNSFLNQVAP
jgi:hypothetical protein